MPAQADVPVLADMPVQVDVHALTDIPSQFAACGQRDMPTRGDYEAVAKCIRSASARSSTCLVEKSHHSFTTELAKELSSPQHALEVAGAAVEVLVSVVATYEVASDVSVLSEAAPATSEPDIAIVTGLGTGAIPSPPVRCLE